MRDEIFVHIIQLLHNDLLEFQRDHDRHSSTENLQMKDQEFNRVVEFLTGAGNRT